MNYQLDGIEQWVTDCQQLCLEIDKTKSKMDEEIHQLNEQIEILKGKLFRLENPDKF